MQWNDYSQEKAQIQAVRAIVEVASNTSLFLKRREINVLQPPHVFDRDAFWKQLVNCLCSSVQRVGPTSPVARFESMQPFPLSLETCESQADLQSYAGDELHKAGIRFGPTISRRIYKNLEWLRQGGWPRVEGAFHQLSQIPRNASAAACIALERDAARLATRLDGIGPKQSRNLWICLGVTRYEIPLDSRVADWVNKYLPPLRIETPRLQSMKYYEAIESEIQALCEKADVFPCEFDAAAFMSEQ